METSGFGLYRIEINGIRLYSTYPDELLRIAKEYELLGYDSVVIRYPNGEVMYGRVTTGNNTDMSSGVKW